jgi:hypothetical protein
LKRLTTLAADKKSWRRSLAQIERQFFETLTLIIGYSVPQVRWAYRMHAGQAGWSRAQFPSKESSDSNGYCPVDALAQFQFVYLVGMLGFNRCLQLQPR